jgi:hypothetical protein
MQTVIPRAGQSRRADTETPALARSFHALLLLSGRTGVGPEVVRRKLGLSQVEFQSLADQMQRGYLVDVVSEPRGGSVFEYLRLTDQGNSELRRMLESMCELPGL